jgi:hypothetical protein
MDSPHELELGNLSEQDFDEMWNGPTAQDLRRAHYTWDYPSLCKTCRFSDRAPAQENLPILDTFLWKNWMVTPDQVPATLVVQEPEHMWRHEDPPVIRIVPDRPLAPYLIALSLGGQLEQAEVFGIDPVELPDGMIELPFPAHRWNRLGSNLGYWWTVIGFTADERAPVARMPEVRCLVRHEPMPRIEGSRLKYPDEGHFPGVYLGGNREVGWKERGKLPARPPLSAKGIPVPEARGPRFEKLRKTPDVVASSVKMTPDAYAELIERIRAVVNSALPQDTALVVASKGDPELLYFDGRPAWHFPCDESRDYAGHHPPDSDSAIGHLERMRDEGAEFFLLPVTSYWWLEHYAQFAAHLRSRYAAIVEDVERCTIFDLREALPGRPE